MDCARRPRRALGVCVCAGLGWGWHFRHRVAVDDVCTCGCGERTGRGEQPTRAPILDGEPYGSMRDSKLDTTALAARLATGPFPVEESLDPGRFLCNYVYYKSLAHTAVTPGQVH